MLLKAQLFGLTEIPPDRQKLLIKVFFLKLH